LLTAFDLLHVPLLLIRLRSLTGIGEPLLGTLTTQNTLLMGSNLAVTTSSEWGLRLSQAWSVSLPQQLLYTQLSVSLPILY